MQLPPAWRVTLHEEKQKLIIASAKLFWGLKKEAQQLKTKFNFIWEHEKAYGKGKS